MSRTERTTARAESAQQRDRFPDLLRSLALGAVILGHWTMAAVSVQNGELHVDNVLNTNRFLWPLTWVLVLIPLFFFVGGFSNATSLTRALGRGDSPAKWLAKRLKALIVPVLPFLVVVVGLVLLALQLGAPRTLTLTVGIVVLMPLWFVAVYSVLAAITVPMLGLHRRYGIGVVVGLAVLACVVDAARTILDEPYIGYANYVLVHGTAQQLGFFYWDGRLGRVSRRALWAWSLGALALLCAVVATPIWSESMVGLSGERSNMSPPSIPTLLHTLFLIPLAMLARPWVARWMDRLRPARILDVAARYSMRAFLWHLPVAVVVYGLVFALSGPLPTPGTGAWWLSRPLMLAILAVVLVGWLRLGDWLGGRRTRRP